MTFNEGMRIDTSTTSTSGGGGGGRGIAIGGGVGGLVIVLLALFLGVDPGQVAPCRPAGARQQSGPGVDVYEMQDRRRRQQIRRVPGRGHRQLRGRRCGSSCCAGYQRAEPAAVQRLGDTTCGPATSDVGPFYCPGRPDRVFRHRASSRRWWTNSVPAVGRWRRNTSSPTSTATTSRTCWAYWAAHSRARRAPPATACAPNCRPTATPACGPTTRRSPSRPAPTCRYLEPLSDKDIADALSAAASVGDDRIQKAGHRPDQSREWTHGSSAERQKWFTVGYQTGDPNQCDTFKARDLG